MQRLGELACTVRDWGIPAAVCVSILCAAGDPARSAEVTRHVFVGFDGALSGLSYALGAGDVDATGSFAANGSVSIGGGVADVPGDVDATSGFYFDASSLGTLTTQNWLAEVVFSPDVAAASQPGTFNHFLDVQGDTYFRYSGDDEAKAPEFGFFDGTTESIDPTVRALPTNRFSHMALTWTASANTLEAFVDGVSQGTLSTGAPFTTPSNRVSFGFFARDGFIGRAVDGKLEFVAFSTFTGDFEPGSDFQLVAPPAPITATVNRDAAGTLGSVTITNNSAAPFPIAGYSVTSANGALDPTNWDAVTGRLDAPGGNGGGNGAIDPDDDWVILSDADSDVDLSEFEISFPGGDGGALDAGASLELGAVWRKTSGALEDVVVSVADASGTVTQVPVVYVGNDDQSFLIGDLDFDGGVDVADWQGYLAAAQSDLTGLTAAEAYRNGGDLNSDGASDLGDLDAFVTSYDALHGEGAFAATLAAVPEPGSLCLLACVVTTLVGVRMKTAPVEVSHGRLCVSRAMRRRRLIALAAVACLACAAATRSTSAAEVTPRVLVNFDGALDGTTYNLGEGEIDATGTFRANGSATVANGVADIPGDLDDTSGFLFNSVFLPTPLTTTNWITEAVFVPEVPAADQPNVSQPFNHFLDVQGDLFFRFNGNNNDPKITQFGYWDGAAEPTTTVPDPPTNRFSHVALTWDAGSNTLEAFVDGVSQGSLSTGNAFDTPSTNVGYGFFSRSGFLNRAIDGKLASVGFSTFTGTFNPGFGPEFDFQLDPTDVPSLVLELEVNIVSGSVSIVNNTPAPVPLRGYEVSSAAGSLDVTTDGWLSLSDQNIDTVTGGDDPGETWEEGANPSSSGFLEGFLLGSTTLNAGESLYLGRAYDELIDAQDLRFRYRLASTSGLIEGLIDYDDTPPLVGDYNNDGLVDAADYALWRDNLGGSGAALANRDSGVTGPVGAGDYTAWRSDYGASPPGGAASGLATPEPATSLVLACGIGLLRVVSDAKRARRG